MSTPSKNSILVNLLRWRPSAANRLETAEQFIREQTGYPPSTIQRYMKDWKVRQHEAADEATDTAM